MPVVLLLTSRGQPRYVLPVHCYELFLFFGFYLLEFAGKQKNDPFLSASYSIEVLQMFPKTPLYETGVGERSERWKEIMSRSDAVCRMMCRGSSRETAERLNRDVSQQADRSKRTFCLPQPHLPSFSRRAATMSQFI